MGGKQFTHWSVALAGVPILLVAKMYRRLPTFEGSNEFFIALISGSSTLVATANCVVGIRLVIGIDLSDYFSGAG
jgi:hypothetical protein